MTPRVFLHAFACINDDEGRIGGSRRRSPCFLRNSLCPGASMMTYRRSGVRNQIFAPYPRLTFLVAFALKGIHQIGPFKRGICGAWQPLAVAPIWFSGKRAGVEEANGQ